ncbi:hypothetical protein U472_12900 [Orenia metallireducens]|uniref:HD-GYP domain-containing protein n=1 Tax=Orenia metallireducens TaxID=1413210 RepID=A0A1C0A536_9FIRM|nr:HD-GYP domain-containing protein [Orenia metallireducens]OCL25252.1 hypothetical protein U472_12900 [Orenia metallireducens]
MRIVKTENVTSKMKLAKAIYHQENILLNTNCKNLYKYKERLLKLGIRHLYIEDKISEDIEINNLISEETRLKGKIIIKKVFSDISKNQRINIDEINNFIEELTKEILNSQELLANLVDIKSYDSYTFDHSVNVAALSLLIGKSLNYNKEQLIKLGVGSILHDIGKIAIPKNILNKTTKLNDHEFKTIKKHPRLGYENIKEHHEISPISRIVILSHHEKVDGSGYPKGLIGDEIHEFAKIVAITDVFDALTSDRCYRKKWSINKTIDFLIANANSHFDINILNTFIQKTPLYPNGTLVKLSNGAVAVVKEQNKSFPLRPIVKIIKDSLGNRLKEPYILNLLEVTNITIINEDE